MELSELTAYAEEKYHIREQSRQADFPGCSVLTEPVSGKWAALLMRQWDSDTGSELQRCDIKCGRQILSERRAPYLSRPFFMKGDSWVGVIFDRSTEPEVVFELFDRAVCACRGNGGYRCGATLDSCGDSRDSRGCPVQGADIVLDTPPAAQTVVWPETAIPAFGAPFSVSAPEMPEKIREMRSLYEYHAGSFEGKWRNFVRQGKFMEAYEDDAPWDGEYRRYFPTYHDLNLPQLRGYFTWRTRLRRGEFTPVSASLAYLYVYELLNGIGVASPEECLRKMQEFEAGFLDAGMGDPGMRKNLRRWMLEYAVLHDVSPELARRCADPDVLRRDAALAALRAPESSSDVEIFSALFVLAGKNPEQSPVVKRDAEKGKRLFASVWRCACQSLAGNGRDLFTVCFGKQKSFAWHPLGNAVYREENRHPDTDYALDPCRLFLCRSGVWEERRYDSLYFDKDRLRTLLHEADRVLRRALKTGHYLKELPGGAWAADCAQEALLAERRAEQEAARPKIAVELSRLERIRQEAGVTRDSLLVAEEPEMAGELPEVAGEVQEAGEMNAEKASAAEALPSEVPPPKAAPAEVPEGPEGLDETGRRLLRELAEHRPVEAYLRANHLMPSVVADAVNEALFDEIGDNVLECDGDRITLVEDYREDILDILRMLGGYRNE
ncbi:MAG: TerB N-terminal domain-containing protein [Eubacteriales bacterium]|nr:TerB N-terminal domain-containing protein [Eubacteriales bacterium]